MNRTLEEIKTAFAEQKYGNVKYYGTAQDIEFLLKLIEKIESDNKHLNECFWKDAKIKEDRFYEILQLQEVVKKTIKYLNNTNNLGYAQELMQALEPYRGEK